MMISWAFLKVLLSGACPGCEEAKSNSCKWPSSALSLSWELEKS